jgi:transposase
VQYKNRREKCGISTNGTVELQRKIRRHYDAILATMKHHLSNAVLEATNRKIQLSVYMAYGFRNIDNLIDMIMLRCSDIDVRLPWEYQAAA